MLSSQFVSSQPDIRDSDQAQRSALVNLVQDGSIPMNQYPNNLSTNQIHDAF